MLVAGLDEVGWGAAAGPLVSVVVVMKDADYLLIPKGVTDSKKLTALRREAFYNQLYAAVTDKGIGAVFPDEIDRMSPKWALQESYKRALGELKCVPDKLIVDGTEWTNMVKSWKGPQVVVPKADLHHVEVDGGPGPQIQEERLARLRLGEEQRIPDALPHQGHREVRPALRA
jgi:ribonuclease HII